MASCRTPPWKRFLIKFAPLLFRKCLGYNHHWCWDRYCACVVNVDGQGYKLRVGGNQWIDLGTE
jgi:hypothetical protein